VTVQEIEKNIGKRIFEAALRFDASPAGAFREFGREWHRTLLTFWYLAGWEYGSVI
jgi:hypothetical protein